MSRNLIFVSKVNRLRWEDFLFQTPTELTLAVMKAEGNLETQLKLIVDFVQKSKWWTSAEKKELIQRIHMKVRSGEWKFGMT